MANQAGGDLFGRSRVIAPDGSIVAEAARTGGGPADELLVVDVDLPGGIERADRESGALRR